MMASNWSRTIALRGTSVAPSVGSLPSLRSGAAVAVGLVGDSRGTHEQEQRQLPNTLKMEMSTRTVGHDFFNSVECKRCSL
jgi:hypothetical protein